METGRFEADAGRRRTTDSPSAVSEVRWVRRIDADTKGALKLDIEELSGGGMGLFSADAMKATVATLSASLPKLRGHR